MIHACILLLRDCNVRFSLSSRSRFQVGDQILRVNGYPVEDAVHQEVALLAKNQQVLVLKIRSNYLAPPSLIIRARPPVYTNVIAERKSNNSLRSREIASRFGKERKIINNAIEGESARARVCACARAR